ncbi:MAG TPA: flavin reductase family protein [Mycobacteriales bacterium]|nr:flavin reductase family protein [Mycobacteriales bacterium]
MEDFRASMRLLASGVVVVCVHDEEVGDDVGLTTSSFASVSLDPPLVAVMIDRASYLDELLERQDRWAGTILAGHQSRLASRFAAAGRPSARLLLAGIAHHRGEYSGGLIVEDALAGLECRTEQRIAAGDHTILVAAVERIDYTAETGVALTRFAGRYLSIGGSAPA